MPKHRQGSRAVRHGRSHRTPAHRHVRTHRHPKIPLAYRGHLAALSALAVALGGAATYGSHLGRSTAPAPVYAVAADRLTPHAASRDLDRLSVTASAVPRPSPSPLPPPLPSRSPAPVVRRAAAAPAGCAPYHGNQLIACTLLPSYGFSLSQMGPLINLWNGESGWRTSARNPSSGAYGIPQSLPAGKMASAGADWRTNPATQIRWGLGYIKGAYGTPANAWAMWQARSPHWY